MVQGYCEYQSIMTCMVFLWQMETHDPQGHGSQECDWWYSSYKLLGMCLRNTFQSICLIFIIYVRLYYRCVKNWMVKICPVFGWLSISQNFSGTKISLHTIHMYTYWYFNAATNLLSNLLYNKVVSYVYIIGRNYITW